MGGGYVSFQNFGVDEIEFEVIMFFGILPEYFQTVSFSIVVAIRFVVIHSRGGVGAIDEVFADKAQFLG